MITVPDLVVVGAKGACWQASRVVAGRAGAVLESTVTKLCDMSLMDVVAVSVGDVSTRRRVAGMPRIWPSVARGKTE